MKTKSARTGMTFDHLTMNDFASQLHAARAGEVIVYGTGFSLADAADGKDVEKKELQGLRQLAWSAHEAGTVYLTQMRVGPGAFEFRATKAGLVVASATIRTRDASAEAA